MKDDFSQLTNSLLKANSLPGGTLEEIGLLTRQYPYFSALQLLLSKKMLDGNHKEFKRQAAKTSLYFKNPVYFSHVLHSVNVAAPEEDILHTKTTLSAPEYSAKFERHDNDEWVIENRPEQQNLVEASVVSDVAESENHEIRTLLEREISQSDQEMELAFGPYHTVDYFASQGIEVKDDEKPADTFSVQLKSFTEWLKELKKNAVAHEEKHKVILNEEKIISMAEHSLDSREVLTESMAEVWEKQGERAKAIEVYTKLSLLNPSKSAYFASLIEKIKDKAV